MTNDPKQGEREYFARIGEDGRRHAARKPFGDAQCAEYLVKTSAYLLMLPPPPARIVEFGCGTGWLALVFAERGYDVIGIDISPEAIAIAEQLRRDRNLDNVVFRVADYEDVRIDPPVDAVVFHDALHHAESELAALRAAHAVLREGGRVLCIEPGIGHSTTRESRLAVAQFGVHEKDMPPAVIIRHARAAGFRRHAVLPWPWFHMRAVYGADYGAAPSRAAVLRRTLSSLVRLVRYYFRRRQGMVVLWKG